MTPALFLMGVGPIARWREATLTDLTRRLRWAAAVSLGSAVTVSLVIGQWRPMTTAGLLLAAWVASTAFVNLVQRLREHPAPSLAARVMAQSGGYFGMLLAHLGVAVFILGVTVVMSFQTEVDVRMEPGDTATVGGFQFRLEAVNPVRGPNYTAMRGTLTVKRGDQSVATLTPERRVYDVSRAPMTEVAIDRGVGRDLYIALGEPVSQTAWSVRLHHKPFVNWIWGGCVLMALGGFLAVMDRRYRARRNVVTPGQASAASGATLAAAGPQAV
jgi:cytochrome c-type biogenesis protein CcmF